MKFSFTRWPFVAIYLMPSPPKLNPSEVGALCPDFDSIVEIGSGGFKTVYRASADGITEVIKVIAIPAADGSPDQDRYREECLQRVRREVNILGQCTTPFMVRLGKLPLQGHELNGDFYAIYSEEFLQGPDLRALIRSQAILPDENEAKLLMNCLLRAIKELWSKQYVHRDIKPANVIRLNDPERPFVLIDLGIAFGLQETGITVSGAPCTLRYLAPEMANPNFRSSLDYRSDLYTTALTVFEFASGKHPIARDSDDQIHTISRALRDAPKFLQEERPTYSLEFCTLIDQLLKKKPALRPANLDHLIKITQPIP